MRFLTMSLCLLCLMSCAPPKKDFYTRKGGWDYQRIPLTEPYEITNTRNGWIVDLPNIDISKNEGWSYVTEVNMIDSVFVFYWAGDKKREWGARKSWAFIVPSKKIEAKFYDEQKYLDSLSYYTKKSPTYRTADEVWEEFNKNTYLEWFPEKYKPPK